MSTTAEISEPASELERLIADLPGSGLIAADLPPSRARSLAAEGFTADNQRLPDIRGADAVVGHEANQVRAVFSAKHPLVGARGEEVGRVYVLQPEIHDVCLDPAEVAVDLRHLG